MTTKEFIYKYIEWIIIFFACITIPFLFVTYEQQYEKAHEALNDFMVRTLEDGTVESSRNQLLELMAKEEAAEIHANYQKFVGFISVLIGYELINFIYLYIGKKYNLDGKRNQEKQTQLFSIVFALIEILYLGIIIITYPKDFISDNYWSLFFINILIIIVFVIFSLLVRFLRKVKE